MRCGQVVLYELTDLGRTVCSATGIDPGPLPRESLPHRYWVRKTAQLFEAKGYEVTKEHPIKGNGAVDILAERPGERVAIEIETGKSDIKANIQNTAKGSFDRVILVATSPDAIAACQRAMDDAPDGLAPRAELLTWLDVS